MLIFERTVTDGISQLSYLVGDTAKGVAAVIDPRPDAAVYLELAERHGVSITHVFETHIHADFMSGARALAVRVPEAAIYASGEGDAEYGFDVEPVRDGDRFEFGSLTLTALHTPGHTPEHIALLASNSDKPDEPWGVFTGDSLFVGSAGRPDLLGDDEAQELTEQLFRTLTEIYGELPDHVILYPGHGAGSACGADIGDRLDTTLGWERKHNPFLQRKALDDFKAFAQENAPPEPAHYRKLKKLNAAGPPPLNCLPIPAALPPERFKRAADKKSAIVLDTRSIFAFGGGHVPGALNIADQPMLSVWAPQMIALDARPLLVLEDDEELDRIVRLLVRVGFTEFGGYLAGGMNAWVGAGLALQTLPQMSVHDVHAALTDGAGLQVLDVRSPSEYESGHLPGASHRFVADMADDGHAIDGLDRDKPTAVYCGSGYRASIAASLLQARGWPNVRNVPGSMKAWKKAGYDTEGG